ncbi:MAG TPA: hypothetical protein VJN70_02780 [Gemmatimonadaceae bacterium]|nr:hypothetical protein [Gemmatimonadaceae bacterium]
MRFPSIVQLPVILLAVNSSSRPCRAQSDTAAQKHIPLYAWLTAGVGASQYGPLTTLRTEWLAFGHLGAALRRLHAGAGINTTERVEHGWLLGARTTLGPFLLAAGVGRSQVTGRNSNGEQSGSTTPIAPETGSTAQGELSLMLGSFVSLGGAVYRTQARTYRNRGKAVFVQIGRLR